MSDKKLLHTDKDKFKAEIMRVAIETGFDARLIEKDYYISLILYDMNGFDKSPLVKDFGKFQKFDFLKQPIFKGGTCLNKIYYGYFRLSEDLDFTVRFANPDGTLFTNSITRGMRSRAMKSITAGLPAFVEKYGMKVSSAKNPGNDNNRQYAYRIIYESIIDELTQGDIKLDIGLYANVKMPPVIKDVHHKFHGPFSDEDLIVKTDPNTSGKVLSYDLKEVVAEKLRAAATRGTDITTPAIGGIAPRDFYDLNFVIGKGYSLSDRTLLEMFKIKGFEDGKDWPGLPGYINNLGRNSDDIKLLYSRVEPKLSPILAPQEYKNFDMKTAMNNICGVIKKIVDDNIFSDLNKPETIQEYQVKTGIRLWMPD